MPLRLEKREGSPYWQIVGTVAGRRIRESAGTDSKKLAAEKLATLEAAAYRQAVHGAPAERRTFAGCVASYLEHAGPHAPATEARVSRLLEYFGATTPADAVDQAALDKTCVALLRPNPAPATRLREIITPARAVLTHGARRRMCALPAFEPVESGRARTTWLTPGEADRLAASAAVHLQPLAVFKIATGGRLGELLALDWRTVDMVHGRAVFCDTKNGRDRQVDLCPRAVAALRAAAALWGNTGRVFRTNAGEPFADKAEQGGGQIKTGFAGAVRRAGIDKDITPHGLRHTWASWRYAEHRDLLLLRFEGDWSTVDLVQRYAHIVPAGMVDTIAAWRACGTLLTQTNATPAKTLTIATA